MTPDAELLIRYAREHDEVAFSELVHRHLGHVYSTALRVVGNDAHLAQDVAQEVFIALAQNADALRKCRTLSGWLHSTARFIAAKIVRAEQRRRHREQTSLTAMLNEANCSSPDWKEVRSCLDEAIGELNEADRDALLLRYFEKKPFAEVGAALGLTENAARMRVERALDKLRGRLARRGMATTAVFLSAALTQHAVASVSAELEAQIVSQAITHGSAGDGSGTTAHGFLSGAGQVALVCVLVLIAVSFGVAYKLSPSLEMPAAAAGIAEASRPNFNAGEEVRYRCESCGRTYRAPCICCGAPTRRVEKLNANAKAVDPASPRDSLDQGVSLNEESWLANELNKQIQQQLQQRGTR